MDQQQPEEVRKPYRKQRVRERLLLSFPLWLASPSEDGGKRKEARRSILDFLFVCKFAYMPFCVGLVQAFAWCHTGHGSSLKADD